MILKIIIYILVSASMAFGEHKLEMLSSIGLTKGSHIVIVMFALYLFLLFWEIGGSIRKGGNYLAAKKRSFFFSFWIGGLWGIMGTFAAGFHYKLNPFFLIINFCVAGCLFGVIGLGIVKLFFNRLGAQLKSREKEKED